MFSKELLLSNLHKADSFTSGRFVITNGYKSIFDTDFGANWGQEWFGYDSSIGSCEPIPKLKGHSLTGFFRYVDDDSGANDIRLYMDDSEWSEEEAPPVILAINHTRAISVALDSMVNVIDGHWRNSYLEDGVLDSFSPQDSQCEWELTIPLEVPTIKARVRVLKGSTYLDVTNLNVEFYVWIATSEYWETGITVNYEVTTDSNGEFEIEIPDWSYYNNTNKFIVGINAQDSQNMRNYDETFGFSEDSVYEIYLYDHS